MESVRQSAVNVSLSALSATAARRRTRGIAEQLDDRLPGSPKKGKADGSEVLGEIQTRVEHQAEDPERLAARNL